MTHSYLQSHPKILQWDHILPWPGIMASVPLNVFSYLLKVTLTKIRMFCREWHQSIIHSCQKSLPSLNIIPIKLEFNPDVLSCGHSSAFDMSLRYGWFSQYCVKTPGARRGCTGLPKHAPGPWPFCLEGWVAKPLKLDGSLGWGLLWAWV